MVFLINKIQQYAPTIQKKNADDIPKEYQEIAEGMESQFVDFLFTEMGKSISKETPDSAANNYYNSLLNYERAQSASKQGEGVGLKKMILDQIYPRHAKLPNRQKNDTIEMASQDVKATPKEN
ncbi:MAG: rod-binding protein [Bacteriovoracaceae bacterium]